MCKLPTMKGYRQQKDEDDDDVEEVKDEHDADDDEQEEIEGQEPEQEARKANEKKVECKKDADDPMDLPLPPPAKISKTKFRDRKLPTHNIVSSTTADEQSADINMFLPPLPLPSSHYFPFPSPLPPPPSPHSLSFVALNATDWLQFFRSPLFVPGTFRLPLPTMPRRFPFELGTHSSSAIGSGPQSAFKPPVQKRD